MVDLSVRVLSEGVYPKIECAGCKCSNKHNELVALVGPLYLCRSCLAHIKEDIAEFDTGKFVVIKLGG